MKRFWTSEAPDKHPNHDWDYLLIFVHIKMCLFSKYCKIEPCTFSRQQIRGLTGDARPLKCFCRFYLLNKTILAKKSIKLALIYLLIPALAGGVTALVVSGVCKEAGEVEKTRRKCSMLFCSVLIPCFWPYQLELCIHLVFSYIINWPEPHLNVRINN